MGGSGAQKRRRLQRQPPKGGSSKEYHANGDNGNKLAVKGVNRYRAMPAADAPLTRAIPARLPTNTPPSGLASRRLQAIKSKIKKPKHLKRKLETTDDTSERQLLLTQLKEFEHKKNNLAAKSQPYPAKKARTESKASNQDDFTESSFTTENKPEQESHNHGRHTKTDDQLPERKEVAQSVSKQEEEKSPNTNSDDSSDDESVNEAIARQRGKRRRGRKDTSILVEAITLSDTKAENATGGRVGDPDPTNKKTTRQDDNRYCRGRKPVTDFRVGESYPGKVVYSKQFGVFLDIGSHSDAFCHVSRCQDDFVESAEAVHRPGDEVSARILEIDKRRKRITVSLQSEAKLEDERKSIQARQQRLEKRKPKSNKNQSLIRNDKDPVTHSHSSTTNDAFTKQLGAEDNARSGVNFPDLLSKAQSEMTPTELKRARKLERRAARREAQPEKQ
jgi:predicted RNA-binding protein with RPS1 domain